MRKKTIRRWTVLAVVLLAATVLVAYGWGRRQHALTVDRRIAQHMPLIRKHAVRAGLPVELVAEVVRAESGGDEEAVSSAGARGLMQLTPATERDMRQRLGIGTCDIFDPDYNLALGTAYLRLMLDQFGGGVELALAAYNMGPTALQRLQEAYPQLPADQLIQQRAPAATAGYVSRIMRRYHGQ
jgi:soluble lytic murein transglycosylase